MAFPSRAARPSPPRTASAARWRHKTGQRIVDLAYEDIKPKDILTKQAFENAIALVAARRRLDQRPAAHRGHGAPCRPRESPPMTGGRPTTSR
ncbi:dihydroxy-acid dehydratase [Caulobacter segnis]